MFLGSLAQEQCAVFDLIDIENQSVALCGKIQV